jgi:hypothetical protein
MMPTHGTRIGIGKKGHSLLLPLELAPLLILLLYLGLYYLSVLTEALPVLASKRVAIETVPTTAKSVVISPYSCLFPRRGLNKDGIFRFNAYQAQD